MNNLKFSLIASLMLGFGFMGLAQESQDNQKKSVQTETVTKTPTATNTIKTGGQLSEVTQKVIELAEGDNAAAERTVRYLKVEMNPPVTQIVSDKKHQSYGNKIPKGVISESEVIELINQFK
ncbi:MAG: hypothetical protein PF448_05485 [Bacteroidales bacterium]|jgi:hypothetical protein|nr:hypothetical protein [Bacteroidales bacterium]